MMETDVQGHCLIMSVAVYKRMPWPRRRTIINNSRQRSRMRVKLCIVITTKEQENSKLSCRVKENWCWCDQFAEEKQQKLEEKAVEDQTENEVESHVDEAMELQVQRIRFRW